MTQHEGRFSLLAVGQSAFILVIATFSVQVIGIVRELYVAAQVGLSAQLDALIIGIALPMMIASVLTAGIQPAMVPAYMEARDTSGIDRARRLAGTVLVWALLAGALLAVLMVVLAEPLVFAMGPGLEESARVSAIGYLRLVAPSAVALAAMSVLVGACQAERAFITLGASIILGPLATLAIMLALWSQLGLTALALGSLVGPFIAAAFLFMAMALRRIAPRPAVRLSELELGAFVHHALPLGTSAALLQLNPIFDRAIATLITPGGVSALRFGDSLLRAPISAINAAWGAAIYPALVRAAHHDGEASLANSTVRTLRYLLAFFVPVALLAVAVAPLAVAVVYGRGAFGPDDIEAVSRVLAAFAPMIFIVVSDEVLTSALNARRRGLILLGAGAMNVVLNLILDLVFGITLGVVGIALSSTVTAAIVTTWKARRFARLEGGVDLRMLGRTLLQATAAIAPAAIAIGVWTRVSDPPSDPIVGLGQLIILGVVGLASYVVISRWVGLPEPRLVAAYGTEHLATRLRRRGAT